MSNILCFIGESGLYDIDFLDNKYKEFLPIITKDFEVDKDKFSAFWNEIKIYKVNCRNKNSLNKL